jgi:anthranilate synthase/aminodeoxychorismate synthase-like glutamine amidotransferase
MQILIIDNYDSFTYNLFQYVAEVGKTVPQVFCNDKISLQEVVAFSPDAIIISPGPGSPTNPKDFGISAEVITSLSIPILGVCLGHQGIGALCGASVVAASEVMHGRTSKIFHTGKGLFAGIPQGFTAVRYHSLILDSKSLSKELEVTAITYGDNRGGSLPQFQRDAHRPSSLSETRLSSSQKNSKVRSQASFSALEIGKSAAFHHSEIMGIQHKTRPLYGVQFHPESIGTEYGKQLIANFLKIVKTYEKK